MTISPGEVAAAPSRTSREPFWNLPNTITMLRGLAIPLILLLPIYQGPRGSRVIAWIFILAATTDVVDGWLARWGQQVTRIGKLLDPLVDKLLVATSLVVLLAIDRIPQWGVPLVVVIIGRELAVTGLRGIASADGHIMPARFSGKLKTLVQNVAIGALLFPDPTRGLPAHPSGMTLLTLATLLTLYSGWEIFADYFRAGSPRVGSG
ncbi:MAG TPA: CDP-diacylglycerol--glycerol-3-phosphate 3-phosphatidyltransferase, partial [Myxococcota bacterium]|nr:CDP-diacylglycerol--glycerol-3-phosphate 3-phosphatidyltransferase [Myxococcota bacterium]